MRTRSQNSKKEKTAINSLPDEVNQISLLNHKRYRSNKRNIKANHIPKQTTNKRQFLLYKNITSLSYWKNNTTVGSGLKNVGNTCYINSVLQCLLYIPPLKNFLDYTEHSYHCHIKGICFICEYCKLSKQTQANKGVSSGIIPYNILKNISYIASNFTLGSQEDAHEFLLYFITCLEISYMKYSNQILRKRNDDQVTKLLPNGYNIIQGIFGGKIISSVTCGRCKTVSSKIDNFSDISLDIANNDNLFTCFDNFCEVEKLTGDNKYYCEKCKRKCNAQKQFLFKEFPQILILHLKRFDNYQRKIKKFVEFEMKYDLTKFSDDNKESSIYHLRAVLIHEGYSIHSGHYYSYVKMPDEKWYCFNDSKVKQVSINEVLNLKPYILFYEKRSSKK